MTVPLSTDDSARPRVALVGAGALGTALALRLADRGYVLRAVVSRTEDRARALAERVGAPQASAQVQDLPEEVDLVLLCVPDDALPALSDALYLLPRDWSSKVVAHTSGALTAEVLAPLAARGAATLSFHPLQSFVRPLPELFEGIYVGVEGDARARAWGERLARDLGAQPLVVPPEAKARYHLAASLASNFLVALMGMVDEVLSTTGIERAAASDMMRPLVEQTWQNLAAARPEEALTGPVARGDEDTIRCHLEALRKHLPHLLPAYAAMATESARLAVRGGKLAPDRAQRLLDALHTALESREDGFL